MASNGSTSNADSPASVPGHDRRQFLTTAATAAGAGLLVPYWTTPSQAADASATGDDRPQIAIIGAGGRGRGITIWAAQYGDIAAVCDLDERHRYQCLGVLEGRYSQTNTNPKKWFTPPNDYEDYRRVLDLADIDAVLIATPDHWHAKIAIEAMQAGKDVYCEKPMTLTIDEGKHVCKAVEQTGRVMQLGTQQRSIPQFIQAIALVREGRLGEVERITVGIDRAPYSDALPATPVSCNLDWDKWLGQCPMVDHRFGPGLKRWTGPKSLGDGGSDASNGHAEFRWWYEYSGGKLTDWGAHHMDICQWLLQQNGPDQGPRKITPVRVDHPVDFDDQGNPLQTDRYNVPTQYEFLVEFPGVPVTVTSEARRGLLIEGTKGRIFVNRDGLFGKPAEELAENPLPDGALERARGEGRIWQNEGDHMADFFDSIRTRRQPVSDAWSHHRALTTCHLMGIAGRLNRSIEWDPAGEQIVGDPVAQAMQAREQRSGYEVPKV